MKRLAGLGLWSCLWLSATAHAQSPQPMTPLMTPVILPLPPPAGLDVAVTTDESTRLSVPVTIGGKSWNFLIDTASTRSVIASDVADSLALVKGDMLQILNIGGIDTVPSVLIPDLGFSNFVMRDIQAPSLLRSNLGGDGLLGLDMLRGSRVSIDFRHPPTLTVSRSSHNKETIADADPGAIVVVARSRLGELIVTDAQIDGIAVVVILDTGSQGTMGNPALAKLLGRYPARSATGATTTMVGVTGRSVPASYEVIGRLRVGDVAIDNVPVAFADLATFKRFGLVRRPAILLGMETLQLFERVAIDFPRHEIKFWLRRDRKQRDAI